MKRLCVVVAVLLLSGIVTGQSTLPCSANCSLLRNQPFSVAYNWAPTTLNPEMADGFRLYQNGVAVRDAGIAALANGSIVFGFPSGIATSGSYAFNVSAYTTGGGETLGDPIAVTISKGKPAKPTNGRIQ